MNNFNSIFEAYSRYAAQSDFEGAKLFLREARDRTRREKDGELATAIGELLAAAHIALGEDEQALKSLREAAGDSPSDILAVLKLATFLFSIMGRYSEALQEISPAASTLLERKETRHQALGLLGAIHASLGDLEEAREFLSLILLSSDLPELYAGSYDFFLVETLVHYRTAPDECRKYLEIVLRSAYRDEDKGVEHRALALLKPLS